MDPKSIYASATRLSDNPKLKQLALFSAGALAVANLLVLLVQLLVESLLQDATGLAAIGKRTALLSVANVFQFLVTAAAPFWTYGFYRVAMDAARQQPPNSKTLLSGFLRFGPLLRMLLIEGLIGTGYVLLGCTLGSTLFMMTPLAEQAFYSIGPALEQAQTITDPAALEAMMQPLMVELIKQIWPMYLLMAIAIGVFLIPWLYHLRLAPYHILDGENRALQAMGRSRQEMHFSRFSLFLLDLRFWWYYGLLLLATVPLYIPMFTTLSPLMLVLTTALSYGLQVLIQWQWLPRVQTSYALVYDALRIKENQS